MDNAAKALIIAGGILVGMLIVTLSMYMYTNFQDAYNKSMLIHNSIEIDAFNSEFTKYGYVGDDGATHISGADAYNILSRAYEVSNDYDSLSGTMEVFGRYSIDRSANNFYERVFYYSEEYSTDHTYVFDYNLEGVINQITIN